MPILEAVSELNGNTTLESLLSSVFTAENNGFSGLPNKVAALKSELGLLVVGLVTVERPPNKGAGSVPNVLLNKAGPLSDIASDFFPNKVEVVSPAPSKFCAPKPPPTFVVKLLPNCEGKLEAVVCFVPPVFPNNGCDT